MIRFIDLGTQIYLTDEPQNREFAFYCTTTDKFKVFNNFQTWKNKQDFIDDYEGDELERYLSLIPEDWNKQAFTIENKNEIYKWLIDVRVLLINDKEEAISQLDFLINKLKVEHNNNSINISQNKLYVWEDVLFDYKSGVMFALAENPEDARNLIEKKMGYKTDDLAIEPKEITQRQGFYVWGGG